jgi:hypothetical protein
LTQGCYEYDDEANLVFIQTHLPDSISQKTEIR